MDTRAEVNSGTRDTKSAFVSNGEEVGKHVWSSRSRDNNELLFHWEF
jgi:hypothetical protein